MNSQASASPRTISVATAAITKIAVTCTALCTSASPRRAAKFANPFQVKVVRSSRFTTVLVRGVPSRLSTGLPAASTIGTCSRPVITTLRSTS